MNDKPKKFYFDLNDFSGDEPVNKKEDEKNYKQEDLDNAREESFKLGEQAATDKIRAEHNERELQMTELLAQQLNALLQKEQQRELSKNLDTTRLTLSIVKKLMPQFAKKYNEDEIIALVKQACHDRADEPRLVVTVHDEILEKFRDKIDDIAKAGGYQGQVIMIADENISLYDCRIEWADGGIEKDFEQLFGAIENAFQSVIHRHNQVEMSPQASPTPAAPSAENTGEINDAQNGQIE